MIFNYQEKNYMWSLDYFIIGDQQPKYWMILSMLSVLLKSFKDINFLTLI